MLCKHPLSYFYMNGHQWKLTKPAVKKKHLQFHPKKKEKKKGYMYKKNHSEERRKKYQ